MERLNFSFFPNGLHLFQNCVCDSIGLSSFGPCNVFVFDALHRSGRTLSQPSYGRACDPGRWRCSHAPHPSLLPITPQATLRVCREASKKRPHSGVYDSAALSGRGKTAHSRSCRGHRGCRPEVDVAEKLDSANGVADRGDDRVQRLVPVDNLYVRIADGLEELRGSFYISLMPPVLTPHQSRPLERRKGLSWKAAEREPGRCTFLAKCSLPFVTTVPKRRVGAGVARSSSAGGAVYTSQVGFGDFSK